MKNSLVARWGLGAMLAGAALPLTALAQTVPPPAAPPTAAPEPTPAPPPPAAAEPAPAPTPATAELPPAAAAPEVTPPPATETPAEEAEEPGLAPPTVTGYVEAGYHINFSEKRTSVGVPLRVYDPPGNSFALHAAHLVVTQKFSDAISAVVELDVGRDALAGTGTIYPWVNKDNPPIGIDVQEAYANYGSGIFTLTAGKFVTYEGIEVIEGPLNPTITRGFLFGWAEPFTHTGVKAHFQLGSAVNFGIGLVNGWDKVADDNQGKTGIARLAFFTPTDPFFAALSGSVGPEQVGNSKDQRISVDLTGAITPSSAFSLWYQFNIGTEKNVPMIGNATWWGFGLQPVITSGCFSLGGRVEYFSDAKGARTGFPGKYFNITVTPGVKLADVFKLRAEFRADIASTAVLGKADDPGKSQFTGALSAEYSF